MKHVAKNLVVSSDLFLLTLSPEVFQRRETEDANIYLQLMTKFACWTLEIKFWYETYGST